MLIKNMPSYKEWLGGSQKDCLGNRLTYLNKKYGHNLYCTHIRNGNLVIDTTANPRVYKCRICGALCTMQQAKASYDAYQYFNDKY